MTALNKQALRNTANRDWFESWFKSDFHPDKTGPYIKDQLFFAIQAARKPLLDELEAAEKRMAELEARAVNLPKRSVAEVMHMSGFSRDYAEGWCSANDNAIHEIHAAGIGVKGE